MHVRTHETSLSGGVLAGRYRVKHLLGRGGFADVYLAHHLEIESLRVAIKVLHGAHRGRDIIVDRFKREASLLAMLRNRHTVRLIDFGFTREQAPFLVMEFVEGAALDRVIRAHAPLRETDTARVAIHILKALAEAHAMGIVHRDLKPANVLMVKEPGERHPVARVLDFGIAKVMGDPTVSTNREMMSRLAQNATATDQVFCTPLYAAPELLLGTPDFRTDLYALGLVMAEMLDGRPPYLDVDCNLDNSPHLLSSPVPLGDCVEASALASIVRRAVAKRLDERYQSAVEMLAELEIVYNRIRKPEYSERPITLLPAPPVREAPLIELRASQFVPIPDEDHASQRLTHEASTRVAKTMVSTPAVPPPRPRTPQILIPTSVAMPDLAYAVDEVSSIDLEAAPGTETIRVRRGRAAIAAAVAASIVLFLGAVAVVDAGGGRPPSAPAKPAAGPSVPAAELAVVPPPETAAVEPLLVAESTRTAIVQAASDRVAHALAAAPSATLAVRSSAPARLLIDGEVVAELEETEDGVWQVPPGTALPTSRPLALSLVGQGVVYSHRVEGPGPVRLDVDLAALGASAEPAEAEETPRRSRRSSSRQEAEPEEVEEVVAAPTPPRPRLGPPVTPRTR